MDDWNYDWTDERGVAHHYRKVFGWHCSIHNQVCSPFTPVTADDILRRAAADPAVSDDVFVVLRQAAEGRPIGSPTTDPTGADPR